MLKPIIILSLVLTTLTTFNVALNVTSIDKCPTLTPRNPPTNVNDLRVDDIKVIGALGDSVSAGLGIKGFKKSPDIFSNLLSAIQEYRGLSYSAGGDEDAFTIANYIKYYQPNLLGSSVGQRVVGICNGKVYLFIFICLTLIFFFFFFFFLATDDAYHDQLNAALTSATAMNLDKELNYLIKSMKNMRSIDFENDWKMINIQIGSNDMCDSCRENSIDRASPERYGEYVEAAVDKIHAIIPKVIVNLIGNYNVSGVFPLTAKYEDYCVARNDGSGNGCACALTQEGLDKMRKLTIAYDRKLIEISNKYKKLNSKSFAVVYQHNRYDLPKFSMEFFSTLDCFHPSLKGHQWTSKVIWNQLFVPQSQKPNLLLFDENERIHCPSDSDRIITY
ncbi:hypothetical protein INT48_002810 [Thamnidium elegans]|uniref:Uncharacterized protein n=1 Tax=Thamnidium elegans TaxID=101142 RepID=A0A8H7SJF0_9FUNG|nr:hypothetical protein INT48_002810 [Thamnidium elegans]